jgi:hypothetical protein
MIGTLARAAMKIAPTSSAIDGARTSLFCATSPKAPSHAGSYLVPFGKVDTKANKWLDDPIAVQKLWTLANEQLKQSGFTMEELYQ